MLLPSETMLLLFIINYTFVLDARVLSMNRICTFWISHSKCSPTSLKLMLNCELIVWTEEWQEIITKRFSRLLKRLPRKPWSQIVNALTVQTNKRVLLNFLLWGKWGQNPKHSFGGQWCLSQYGKLQIMDTGVGFCGLGRMSQRRVLRLFGRAAIDKAPWAVYTAKPGANAFPTWVINSLLSSS